MPSFDHLVGDGEQLWRHLNAERSRRLKIDVSGSAKNIGGHLEEGFGRVTGDEKMQLEVRARQAEGTLQDVYGQAKETAVDAARAIRDRASEASDFLREMIEERPFTAAAIALGIGFLIGRFGRAD